MANQTAQEARFLGFERAEWWFWLKWVLASAAGWLVGLAVGWGTYVGVVTLVSTATADPRIGEVVGVVVGTALGLVVFGAVVGTAQWLVLRKRVYRSGWWLLVTAVGGAVCLVVVFFVGGIVANAIGAPFYLPMLMPVYGAAVGIAQWLILRKRVHQSGWWLLAAAAGWAVGCAVDADVGMAVFGALFGALFGAITGFVLILLLRHPIPEVRDPQ